MNLLRKPVSDISRTHKEGLMLTSNLLGDGTNGQNEVNHQGKSAMK